jgi:hypothetical protein
MQELVLAAIREDNAKRRPGDSQNVNHLKLIRGHHMQNGGVPAASADHPERDRF